MPPKGVKTSVLARERLVAMVSADHALAARRTV
jgi:DNA-binding transcriptional LysR family regulator